MLRRQILGLLSQGRQHGYALAKEHRHRTWLVGGSGNFYRELKHLCSVGMIRLASTGTAGDPRKVSYEITSSGKADFMGWLTDVPEVSPCPESELATRAPLFFLLPSDTAISLLDDWKRCLWRAIRRLEDANLAPGSTGMQRAVCDTLVQRRTRHLSLELEFVEELKATIAAEREAKAEVEAVAEAPVAKRALTRARS
ncbi:MAG: PadR family transcriptional regulator [Candidatus Binatia bacterium]|nr:PadR family transcriptional regulator [Candidatus Binatia bacterium]